MLVPNASGKPCSRYTFWHNGAYPGGTTLHTSFSAKGHFARAAAARHAHGRGQPRASSAGEEEIPAGRSKGGAGAKLLVETLMSEKNTPDRLRPGPTDDPRIDSLDIRTR